MTKLLQREAKYSYLSKIFGVFGYIIHYTSHSGMMHHHNLFKNFIHHITGSMVEWLKSRLLDSDIQAVTNRGKWT